MMQNPGSPSAGFWCCVAGAVLIAYVATYGVLRWQDVLIHDVRYWTAADGISYSQLGVRDNLYIDDRTKWQELLGPPAELVFFPLCRIEDHIRTVLYLNDELK
jgi:hypothetical protein